MCILLLLIAIPSSSVMEVSAPHFLDGKWSLESRENVDAFLAARGASWFIRKIALGLQAQLQYEFRENQGYISFQSGSVDLSVLTPMLLSLALSESVDDETSLSV